MNIDNYYGWIGIFFIALWFCLEIFWEPFKIIKGRTKTNFKYHRELKGVVLVLAGLFISLKLIKWDPGGYKGPGEWGFFFIFWTIIISLIMIPTIVQKKINKITGKKSKAFEVFYKWLFLIPGYYFIICVFIVKDENHSFFSLEKAFNFLGINGDWMIGPGVLLIFVSGFHFISVVYNFFSNRS